MLWKHLLTAKNQKLTPTSSIGPNTSNIKVYKMKKILKNLWEAFVEARLEAAKAQVKHHSY